MTDENVTDVIRSLIEAFTAMAIVREATGDPAARGVQSCISHLQDYLAHLEVTDD
jgi:hypothetical protein